jgi:hypothetical protein
LIESGVGKENALILKRQGKFTNDKGVVSLNPVFSIGRIVAGGDGDPQVRVIYRDDNATERSVLEFDRKGIVASVKTERGSHFEGFIGGDEYPLFRLNSHQRMRLEMGAGGAADVDVALERTAARTLTVRTRQTPTVWAEQVRINPLGLQVSNGYLQLDTSAVVPPAGHCNAPTEVGRMKVDEKKPILYVCTAAGWRKIVLPAN